ncbi:rhodanese-like domain-containing protein [Zhouia sp. PK063]|uniref:MBL fold metallo-hydrolase n=1 Tax=Zhouia sp. PK063 TaxID=3373602 RepID=UPI0037A59222
MKVKQFEYKPLAHYSYAIVSNGKMAVIDPERNPLKYYSYAKEHNAVIVAVIQTHPHADFVSSHFQIHQETGATIYNSKLLGADYPHLTFDDGDEITLGDTLLKAINTPGHSPDSITIVATENSEVALFTGDTLFIGDVGRPDLREKAGNMSAKRQQLAEMMFHTIQHKFSDLPDSALIYPAHGAGSLCGKNLSSDNSSTLGQERKFNWAFKETSKEKFVNTLLDSQPFIPSYFGYNVAINKAGAENIRIAKAAVHFSMNAIEKAMVVDVRSEENFKRGHLKGSINIQATSENSKFETWLGAIIKPEESFSLVIEHPADLEVMLERVAKIGYEKQLKSIITLVNENLVKSEKLNLNDFEQHPENYTIVDIRSESEINEGKFFESSLAQPLNELRDTVKNIPIHKPIVVHCAGGYRSAAGSSIIERVVKNQKVYDLSDHIHDFKS